MKKAKAILALLLATTMLSSVSFADTSTASSALQPAQISSYTAMTYILDGKTVSEATYEGLLPLRAFSEALGYTVSWDPGTRSVVLKKAGVADNTLLPADFLKGSTLKNGRWYVPDRFFEESLGNTVIVRFDGKIVIESSRYAPDEASTLGEITEWVQGKDGIQILVTGQKFGRDGYNEISLALGRTVPVFGGELNDLKKGTRIYVKYGPVVTKSLPPMGQATAVEILKEQHLVMGKVLEVIKGSTAEEPRLRVVGTSDFLISLSKDTVITDSTGKASSAAAIKEGMIVKVYTRMEAAQSMPPQTGAYRVVIQ